MAIPATPNKGRRIRQFPIEATQTYLEGAPVLLDANGEITEAAADPATILGFAATPALPTELDPYEGNGLVYVAYPDSTFLMQGLDDPVQADVGDQFELAVDANGVAQVDTAQVTNRLLVEDIYIQGTGPEGLYEVSILAANRQFQV